MKCADVLVPSADRRINKSRYLIAVRPTPECSFWRQGNVFSSSSTTSEAAVSIVDIDGAASYISYSCLELFLVTKVFDFRSLSIKVHS